MQALPRCFICAETVEHDPIFEAPCGHSDHGSAVFHPLCLMKWREDRDAVVARVRAMSAEMDDYIAEMGGLDEEDVG